MLQSGKSNSGAGRSRTAAADPRTLAGRAEAAAALLPPLLVHAERIAATVAQGVHGRRRVGQGDSFWQFRPFLPGDPLSRIDWRQSAKSDRAYIRETEWEAAQTVHLWADASPSMRWRSRLVEAEKGERASLLLLALASLLLRGGERVGLLGDAMRPISGRAALDRLAEVLSQPGDSPGLPIPGLPVLGRLARHARVMLFSDFLSPLSDIQALIGRLAAIPVSGFMMQILDPAEAALPYTGRVTFEGLEQEAAELVPRVETIRAAYADRLSAHQSALAAIAAAAGFGFAIHHTDHGAETALLALYTALAER